MGSEEQTKILQSAKAYFSELVDAAINERNLAVSPVTNQYLVELLDFYLVSENLHSSDANQKTLAEAFLEAGQSEKPRKWLKLKKLGDTSLYISGFFGDSLKRKIVDIDYYAEIGGSAYATLASSRPDNWTEAYEEFARRFLDFVDVLTLISQRAQVQSSADILRLYDKYLVTGSELAKDQLSSSGIIAPADLKKAADQ